MWLWATRITHLCASLVIFANERHYGESPFRESRLCLHPLASRGRRLSNRSHQDGRGSGVRFPVFIPRTAFDAYVTVSPDVAGQDEAGRLWDVVWMLRFAIRKAQTGQTRLPFALYVRNDNRRSRLVKLVAMCAPPDMDPPQPGI